MLKFKKNSCPTYVGTPRKNSQIHRKSFQNQPKTVPNREKIRPWTVFGAKSRPGRLWDHRPGVRQNFWESFWPKRSIQGSLWGPLQNPKSLQNPTCGSRQGLGTSKNGLLEGVRKIHENLMKNQCKNDEKLGKVWCRNRWNYVKDRSLQNLDFCDTSRARIDFHRIQGSRKPIKKHENSIQNQCSKKSPNLC